MVVTAGFYMKEVTSLNLRPNLIVKSICKKHMDCYEEIHTCKR